METNEDVPIKNKQGLFIQSLLYQRCQLSSIAFGGSIQRYAGEWENFMVKTREGFRNALIRHCWYWEAGDTVSYAIFWGRLIDFLWMALSLRLRAHDRKTGSCWLAMSWLVWANFCSGCGVVFRQNATEVPVQGFIFICGLAIWIFSLSELSSNSHIKVMNNTELYLSSVILEHNDS